ncbi:MAG: NAD-dependent epimerase/dehydratase family protein [Puniceicoccales bacterium]|nr:NAD-dependent epimerase/dehydratase family protein [Puniceicoccales bacterium]
MKALVTGGSGFLGFHLVTLLQKHGMEVRSFARKKQHVLPERGVECVSGNVTFEEEVDLAMRDGIDVVFHTAGKAGIGCQFDEYFSTNVLGTENVIKACKKYGVKYLIYTSSPSVVFNGKSFSGGDESLPYGNNYHWHYARTKAMAEKYVLGANGDELRTVAVRPHMIIGPGEPHFMPKIVARAQIGELKVVGDGQNVVDITMVENAAWAHFLAFKAIKEDDTACGKAYFIGQESPIRLWDFINDALEFIGIERVTSSVHLWKAYSLGFFYEKLYSAISFSKDPPMTRALAIALSKNHYFSHEAAKRDLGYEPIVSLAEGKQRMFKSLIDLIL